MGLISRTYAGFRRLRGLKVMGRVVLLLALAAPAFLAASASTGRPGLIISPARGAFGPSCNERVMAIGYDFPEGAGVALFAMKAPGLPLRLENIRTVVATAVAQDRRFISGYVGLNLLLCPERGSISSPLPDGTQIDIVAAVGTSFEESWPRDGTELARVTFVVDSSRPVPATQRCFAATLRCTQNRFHDYWLATGGLAQHGFPLTAEVSERLEDGRDYTVQYFERSRLELHPEVAAPNDMQLGQFGRHFHPADPPAAADPGGVYFPETGHNVSRPSFIGHWTANGGLARFGYPLSEEFTERLEDGKEYRVQYFERARLEWHPENVDPYKVLIGQFGRRILAERAGLR